MSKISACLITMNEELDLPNCLASLDFCDEVIVVDSGSVDRTVEVAKQNGALTYYRKFDGFDKQKNFAIQQATNDWILIVDADERVSEQLKDELLKISKMRTTKLAYQVPFKHMFLNRWIKHGGQYPSYHLRFLKKDVARYEGGVHETFRIEEEAIGYLKGNMVHYSYASVKELWNKLQDYSSRESGQIKPSWKRIVIRPIGVFVKRFIVEKGFLDGLPGLIWNLSFAYYEFLIAKKALKL